MGLLLEFDDAIRESGVWKPKRGGGGGKNVLQKYGFDGGLDFGGGNEGTGGGDVVGGEAQ